MSKFIFLKSLPTILQPIKRLIDRKAQDVDWNENDPSSSSYIANRTHYKSTELVTEIPETSIEFANNGGMYVGSYETDISISEGDTKIVVWDGVSYSCIATLLEGPLALGNTGLLGGENNTSEPFLIGFFSGQSITILTTDTSATHTISISGESTIIHKIPDEYLPDIIGIKGTGTNAEVFNGGHPSYASGSRSHAEGFMSEASGFAAHVEGQVSYASGSAAHAEGYNSQASGKYSHAEGYQARASNEAAHAEGNNTQASGKYAHTEGYQTKASQEATHAEGYYTQASSSYQHVQGKYNKLDTTNKYAHIVGNGDSTARSNAHTLDWNGNAWFKGEVYVGGTEQGNGEKLLKQSELPEIPNTNIINGEATGSLRTINATAESDTYKLGESAFAEGSNTRAEGKFSHAGGYYTSALTKSLNVIGEFNLEQEDNLVSSESSQGPYNTSANINSNLKNEICYLVTGPSIAENQEYYNFESITETTYGALKDGDCYVTSNNGNLTEYYKIYQAGTIQYGYLYEYRYYIVSYKEKRGQYIHVVGNGTSNTTRSNAHTLDWDGNAWFAGDVYVGGTNQSEGNKLVKQSELSTILEIPNTNIVNGEAVGSLRTVSSAVEDDTYKLGSHAFTEGYGTKATVYAAHAEGESTTASGRSAHAEGTSTTASNTAAHAEGNYTFATGNVAHAEGAGSAARGNFSHAEGYFTIASAPKQHAQGQFNITDDDQAHIVGNGTSETARSNAHTLDWSGNAWFQGDVYVGSTSGTNKDDGSQKLATESYVDSKFSGGSLMGEADKIKLDNTNVAYGTCETAAATAEKVVTLSGNTNWALTVGAIIMVRFSVNNSASSVKLNVNGTGAYPIWYSNAEYTGAGTAYTGYANRTITYMFNGTHWVWVSGSYDANTQSNTNSTDTSSKIFLVGATTQGSNKTTYSHGEVYVGTDHHVYSNSKQVVNLSDTQALTNKTYEGYTLGAACARGVDTAITDGSNNLITSGAMYTALTALTESEIDAICGNTNLETWSFTMADGTTTEKQVVVSE